VNVLHVVNRAANRVRGHKSIIETHQLIAAQWRDPGKKACACYTFWIAVKKRTVCKASWMNPVVITQYLHEFARRVSEQMNYIGIHAQINRMKVQRYLSGRYAPQEFVLLRVATVVTNVQPQIKVRAFDDRRQIADISPSV
jgi:hypothetical protein